jgi:hypothetical protein
LQWLADTNVVAQLPIEAKKAHGGNRFLTYKNNQIPLKSQG